MGLIADHAYALTLVKTITDGDGNKITLVKIRNPHGNGGMEWKGDWSDNSDLWT